MNEEKKSERFRKAKRNLKEMQKKIRPFTEKEEKSAPSTRGDWMSGSFGQLENRKVTRE